MSGWGWLIEPGVAVRAPPALVALNAAAQAATGLALLAIAGALLLFFHLRQRLRFRWLGWLFAPLLAASAAAHFTAIYTLGSPQIGLQLAIEALSAVVAVGVAVALWVLIPPVVAAPSAAQVVGLNAELAATVEQRTGELLGANANLTQALADLSQAQRALTRSEEQFRVSFDRAMVGKVQAEPATGRLVRVNAAFAGMLGYEPAELVGRTAGELTLPEDWAFDRVELQRLAAGEIDHFVREKRFLRKDGSTVWARLSANIVRFPESGQPDLTIAVIENIDERRRTELALEQHRQELEAAVVERTEALAQKALLIREIYHRVKNNLQVIDALLVLQSRRLTDPAARSAFAALRGRVYALGLVHQQLMGSADLQTFDVAPFLKELAANLLQGAAPAGISLSVASVPLDVGLDLAIPLGLLVTELVTNSFKHAFPDGVGAVCVSVTRGEDGGIVLTVADDGVGDLAPASGAGSQAPGLGATIIDALVGQLGATMTVCRKRGTRTRIALDSIR